MYSVEMFIRIDAKLKFYGWKIWLCTRDGCEDECSEVQCVEDKNDTIWEFKH